MFASAPPPLSVPDAGFARDGCLPRTHRREAPGILLVSRPSLRGLTSPPQLHRPSARLGRGPHSSARGGVGITRGLPAVEACAALGSVGIAPPSRAGGADDAPEPLACFEFSPGQGVPDRARKGNRSARGAVSTLEGRWGQYNPRFFRRQGNTLPGHPYSGASWVRPPR